MIISFSFKSYMSTNHYFNLIRDIVKYLQKILVIHQKKIHKYIFENGLVINRKNYIKSFINNNIQVS